MIDTITLEEIKEKIKIFDDEKFKFDEPSHTYTYEGDKEEYVSSTTFIKRFIKEFDSDFYSKKVADREGRTQQEVLDDWEDIKVHACNLGTEVHEYIEDFYNNDCTINEKYSFEFDESKKRVSKFHEIFETRLNKLTPLVSELRLFNRKWKLAGTIDQLYFYKNTVILGDWKTNKKVKTDKDYSFQNLLYPFNRYKDNEINKYSLQISLYRIMLEEVGIPTHHAFICHIPPKDDQPAKIYELKDFRKELREYLENNTQPKEEIKISNIW